MNTTTLQDPKTIVDRHRFDNVYAVWCADGSVGLCGVVLANLPDGVEIIGNGTCPHPLGVKLSPARQKADELVRAVKEYMACQERRDGRDSMNEARARAELRELLNELGEAS